MALDDCLLLPRPLPRFKLRTLLLSYRIDADSALGLARCPSVPVNRDLCCLPLQNGFTVETKRSSLTVVPLQDGFTVVGKKSTPTVVPLQNACTVLVSLVSLTVQAPNVCVNDRKTQAQHWERNSWTL